MIKVGVIVPTRGDRPGMLDNLIRMINAQTFQPTLVHLVDYEPRSGDCDITQRYRAGYDWFRGMGMDVLALMEDDDFYSTSYLATMVSEWLRHGRPQLFGTSFTVYYNIRIFAYFTMYHDSRSSAMSTLIKPDLDFPWCPDHEPYTDQYLWKLKSHLQGVIFLPPQYICIGIKHGVGLTGGRSHTDRLHRYVKNKGTTDYQKEFLRQHLDPDSFSFYSQYIANANII